LSLLAALPLGSEIASEMFVPASKGEVKRKPDQQRQRDLKRTRDDEIEELTENSGDKNTEESQLEKF